jgi:CHAT domain-containing protein/tetratricopeptide (TPR) repeat protein
MNDQHFNTVKRLAPFVSSPLIPAVLAMGLMMFRLPVASSQSDDSAEIAAVVQKFFAVYEAKDLPAAMAMWDEKSPEAAPTRQILEKTFATVQRIEVRTLRIVNVERSQDQATVRVAVEIAASDAKTGKPAEGFGRLNRTLQLMNKGGAWKISRYISSEEDLAGRIAGAKSQESRKALIAANKDLIGPVLNRALLTEGARLLRQRNPGALDLHRLVQEMAEQLGDESGLAGSFLGLATIYFNIANFSQAREYFEKGLSIYDKIGDKIDSGRCVTGIGTVLFNQGDIAAAVDYYERGLNIAKETGDNEGARRTLHNLGVAEDGRANYPAALAYYRGSLRLSESAGELQAMASTLNAIGVVLGKQGDYQGALEHLQRSLKMAEAAGDKAQAARTLNNLGALQQKLGNYAQSLAHHRASLAIREEVGDKRGLAITLGSIGNLYREMGDDATAAEYATKSLRASEQLGYKAGIADMLASLGNIEMDRGNYRQALEYTQNSLKVCQELGDKYAAAEALEVIGHIYHLQGDYGREVEAEARAASMAREIGSVELLSGLLAAMGNGYQAAGERELARTAYTDAMGAVEQVRNQLVGPQGRQRFLESRVGAYYGLAELLADEGRDAEAFSLAERAKARTLLEVLQSGRVDINRVMTAEEKTQELKTRSELAALNSQIVREKTQSRPDQHRLADLETRLNKAQLDYDGFQTSLYASHPELKVQRGQFQPIALNDCGSIFPDSNTAILEFLTADDRTMLFALTPKSTPAKNPELKVYKIEIKKKDLAELCRQFRLRLSNGGLGYAEPARHLYDLLLAPAAGELAGKSNIIIVPDGVLWDLSFQALKSGPRRFVIEDHSISYAPSLTALREMRKLSRPDAAQGRRRTLLGMGNPLIQTDTSTRIKQAVMDAELGPLPQAETQVKAIGRLYGPMRSKIYLGAQATEDTLKAESASYRILHIAGHGIVNNASPMYSQIVLSRAEGSEDDGLLEAWEIMNMDLKADLAVLSACDTAGGRIGPGEGMIGLSWAFFVAGCPSTVVSQWAVDANSTTELMVEFHRNLLAGLGKAQALRKAELKLLKSQHYSAPFYWAPFVLVGNGS